ncbi:MAG: glycosyltransferase family 4 protein [Proteobacteria bacterium]|nr:glycosyltransferase family 4 protein [Pseudomonadota bacterium]
MPKPRILLFSNWFAPGYKGGGSQSAAVNLVQALKSEFEFRVVTRDRDVAETLPYEGTSSGDWNEVDDVSIRYLAPTELTYSTIKNIIYHTPHSLVHINSVVSLPFACYPARAQHTLTASTAPLLISPHGELSPKALAQKRVRKLVYLKSAKALGIFRNATWHAANGEEEKDITRAWGDGAHVRIAPPLPNQLVPSDNDVFRGTKLKGTLRAIFFARVDRMKNLDLAIDFVASVPNVTLDICGPIGQADYWAFCESKIRKSTRPSAFRYIGGVPPDKVTTTLSQYDVLLLPSQNESFGYAILEALGAGCPVLISNRTPWCDLERHGIGFAIPLDRPDIFLARLETMRDLGASDHGMMRERARLYAQQYVDTSIAKQAMQAIYASMLSRAD